VTITLPLQPQEEEKLIAAAHAKGVSAEALVREALDRLLATVTDEPQEPGRESVAIWDRIGASLNGVPPEDAALLPRDGASQIDHYVYGLPKGSE
jgi:hypothetical protein